MSCAIVVFPPPLWKVSEVVHLCTWDLRERQCGLDEELD